ncbi:unnamed protein product, partial [Polarella glacialis]
MALAWSVGLLLVLRVCRNAAEMLDLGSADSQAESLQLLQVRASFSGAKLAAGVALTTTATTTSTNNNNGLAFDGVALSDLPAELVPLNSSSPEYKALMEACLEQTTLGPNVGPGLGGIYTCTPVRFARASFVFSLLGPAATAVCGTSQNAWFSLDAVGMLQEYMTKAGICDVWPGGTSDVKTALGVCSVEASMVGIVGQGYAVNCSQPVQGQLPSPKTLQLIGGPWCGSCRSCNITNRSAIQDKDHVGGPCDSG